MTAEAADGTVHGAFDGSELQYMGWTARMDRGPGGSFQMRFSSRAGDHAVATVERTVGSHRYQQYLARDRDVWFRLPVAFDLRTRRWFHMNAAFLTPDPAEPGGNAAVSREDFHRHVTRWNDNCVFCHNVGPNPGLTRDASREFFATEVAELGITCEACHGPAGEHARVNRDPLRRYALHLTDLADPTIVNPRRLGSDRANDVCGRCHGQRVAHDLEPILARGDPFVPGEDLGRYSRPIVRSTALANHSDAFAARFWEDGTPRLSAYEFQGMLASACAAEGALRCTDCHGMHDGDPNGQLRPAARGDGACTQCHDRLATAPAALAHGRHRARVPCVDCHMPRVVYGLVNALRSHRIEVPDPDAHAAAGRPDACSQCHVDVPPGWAGVAAARLWPQRFTSNEPVREVNFSATERVLLSGDPIARALAADSLGRARVADRPEVPGARVRRAHALLDAIEHDPYPAVRRMAGRALESLLGPEAQVLGVDEGVATLPAAERKRLVATARDRLSGPRPTAQDVAEAAALRGTARVQDIEIGE